MDSIWKNTRIQRKNSADLMCVILRFLCFSMEDHPMVKRRPKGRSEAERKRKRDEEREDDVGTPPGFGLVFVASENYRNPYVHPKGEKISMC